MRLGIKSSEYNAMEDELAWKDLAKLCGDLYWNRLWIIQEVSLAKKLTICWRETSTPWEYFVSIYKYLEDMKPEDRRPKDNRGTIIGAMSFIRESIPARFARQSLRQQPGPLQMIFAIKGASRALNREPLVNLILYHQGAECKDPRGRVYGNLSLAMECCQKEVIVNYNKTWSEVCKDVLKHHFRQPHWPERDLADTTQTLLSQCVA